MRHRPVAVDFSDLTGPEALAIADPAPRPGSPSQDFLAVARDALIEAGLPEAQAGALALRLDAAAHDEALALAGEALRRLSARLDGTASAVALRRVLAGPDGRSLAEDAMACSVSKQRMHALVQRAERQIAAVVEGGS